MIREISISALAIISLNLSAQEIDSVDDGRVIKIPVIFHVIQSDKEYSFKNKSLHKTDRLHDSLILEELNDLNLDFQALNSMDGLNRSFADDVGNPKINFVIADSVFQDGGTKGIIRLENDNSINFKQQLIKPSEYLNVYIGDFGSATTLNGEYIKLSFTKIGLNTHVLTHEAGHWLGLYHIWGRIGSCNWFLTLFRRNDLIDDTPPQRRCSDLSFSGCSPKNRATEKGELANYNNFMDYSGCRVMFTKMQCKVMRTNIISNRPALYNSQ